MANLYELNAKIEGFRWEVDEETGEILNGDELDAIELERDTKLEQLGLWLKNITADAEAYEKEEKNFAQKKKAAKAKAESIKQYLAGALNGESWKCTRVAYSWRKSTIVEVEDAARLPVEYLIAQEPKLDKAALKNDLKQGYSVPGAKLVERNNLQIK